MGLKPRKKISKRVDGGLTEAAYIYFVFGEFFEGEDFAKGKSEEELEAFWRKHEKEIMGRYLEGNRVKGRPAERPWKFWKWSSPPDQKREIPPEENLLKTWDERRGEYGFFESDFDFLKRLGLLADWELQAEKLEKSKTEKEKKENEK